MDCNLLNNDIVTEILLHLPLKPLLRWRSVCKSWRDYIDSQPFRKSHSHQHANDDEHDDTLLVQSSYRGDGVFKLSMFSPHNGKLYSFPEAFIDTTVSTQVVGPANGVICVYCWMYYCGAPIAVCNPSTGHISVLPTCSIVENPSLRFRWNLFRAVGIYFDEAARDYAVVQLISYLGGSYNFQAFVYSRATNSWRKVDGEACNGLVVVSPMQSLRKNGSFSHWLALHEGVNKVILSFDFKNEGFRVLEIKNYEILTGSGDKEIFAEGDDSFLLFISDNIAMLDIHRSRIDGNRLQLDRIKSVGPFDGAVIPKALCERGCVVLQSKNGYLVLYDYCNEKLVKYWEMEKDEVNIFEIFEYRGSIVLP